MMVGAGVALAHAQPATAAQVREVRVGSHDKYTRVVFELDAPAGYSIQRRSETSGEEPAILVTVNASTKARNIPTKSDLLSAVIVEERLGSAVAEIRLKRSGLRLKEMILANPPRIVLDVMAREAPSRPPESKRSEPMAAPVSKPSPSPKRVAATPSPPKRERKTPRPKVAPIAKPAESAMVVLVEEEVAVVEPKPVTPEPRPARVVPRTAPPRAPAATSSDVPAPTPPAARSSRTSWLIGVAVLVVVILVWRSMQRGRSDESEPEPAADRTYLDDRYDREDPAPVADSDEGLSPSLVDTNPPELPNTDVLELRSEDSEPGDTSVESPFADPGVLADEGVPAAVQGETAGGDLTDRLVELERRLSEVHAKLDASLDGTERVERQLAAQGEELRVQRAAIARTQRALRGLNRSEDEHPTEPALREPLG